MTCNRPFQIFSSTALACPILLFSTSALSAQGTRGVIAGTIADTANAVLQGASVLLDNGFSTVSDPQGDFSFPDLAPGDYNMTVTYLGFDTFKQSVTVTAGQTTLVNAVLKVASPKTQMTVYAGTNSISSSGAQPFPLANLL